MHHPIDSLVKAMGLPMAWRWTKDSEFNLARLRLSRPRETIQTLVNPHCVRGGSARVQLVPPAPMREVKKANAS
jgi:hypothetical protein